MFRMEKRFTSASSTVSTRPEAVAKLSLSTSFSCDSSPLSPLSSWSWWSAISTAQFALPNSRRLHLQTLAEPHWLRHFWLLAREICCLCDLRLWRWVLCDKLLLPHFMFALLFCSEILLLSLGVPDHIMTAYRVTLMGITSHLNFSFVTWEYHLWKLQSIIINSDLHGQFAWLHNLLKASTL